MVFHDMNMSFNMDTDRRCLSKLEHQLSSDSVTILLLSFHLQGLFAYQGLRWQWLNLRLTVSPF